MSTAKTILRRDGATTKGGTYAARAGQKVTNSTSASLNTHSSILHNSPAVAAHNARPGFSPSWNQFYRLGLEAARHLVPQESYAEIGRHYGCRKQKIYAEAMIALGKVVYRLRKSLVE